MSCASAYWPESGALDCFGVLPFIPSMAEKGRQDGVGNLYQRMAERQELILAGQRVADVGSTSQRSAEKMGESFCDRGR